MKSKKMVRFIYKWLVFGMLIVSLAGLTGCGSKADSAETVTVPETSPYQVQAVTKEKYVCAMYPLDQEKMEGTIGKIQNVKKSDEVYTAEYTENLASFCFLLNETGRYKVSIVRGDAVLSEHMVDINEESSYYLLYMPGLESQQ